MPSCDDFEIALERRAHGDALEPELATALDAHLAGCERCRSYRETMTLATGGLGSLAAAARAGTDWAAMERSIRARPHARRRQALATAAVGSVCIALAIWGLPAEGHFVGHAALILALTVPVVLFVLVRVHRETRRALELATREDVFATERKYLARRLRIFRTMRWVAIAVVASGFVNAWFAPTTPARIAYVGMSLVVAGIWLHAWRVRMPELERQASELDPKG